MEHTDLLIDALDCARRAGAVVMSYFRSPAALDIRTKLGDADIVTAADRASETLIKDFIRTRYPSHSILSEESGEDRREGGYRWVIDPLDGTTNFSAGLPIWSISIGIEHDGHTEIGIVFAPYLNEMFHAVRGQGAYLNGEPIKVAGPCRLSQAVVSTGFPVDKLDNPDNNLDNFKRVMPQVRGIRRLGSAAVDMSYVAAGFLNAFWEINLHEWDVNAASLIVTEAGGKVTRFREDRNVSLLCGSPSAHDEILPLLATTRYLPQ